MRLLLIRHGQTPSNVDGFLDTARPGPGLTELGERQAAEIPDALKHEAIDGIYVSVLRRTLITATPLIVDRGLDPVELPGIHEIEAGDLEMRHDHEAYRIYLETAFAWGMGDLDRRMPGATDGHEFFRRFDESIASVTGNNAVVFSHGAAIRVWVAGRAINVPPSFAGEHDIQMRYHTDDKDWLKKAEAAQPFGRLLKPTEVARAVAYLASDESGLMTGSIIDFDQQVLGSAEGAPHPSGRLEDA